MNEKKNRFHVSAENFAKIPGSPIAYWVGKEIFNAFSEFPQMEKLGHPKVGMQTSNNEKFLRLWHEISFGDFSHSPYAKPKWIKYLKGGPFRRWYGNLDYLLFYNGSKDFIEKQKNARVLDLSFLSKHKCTWTDLTSGNNSFRLAPIDTFYDISGHCFFPSEEDQYWLLACSNSKPFNMLLGIINSSFHCQVGDVSRIAVPLLKSCLKDIISNTSRELVSLSRSDWDDYETSWDFKVNPLVREGWQKGEGGMSLEAAWDRVFARRMEWAARMKELEEVNNRLFIEAYGLEDELKPDVAWKDVSITGNPFYRYKVDGEVDAARRDTSPHQGVPEELEARARADAVRELISYGIGCLMGRYSLEQEGLILASQGETYQDYFSRVHGVDKLRPDDDGILPVVAGETAFTDNAPYRVVDFIKAAFGEEHLTENLNFIEATLGMTLEAYLTKGFWDDHKRTYKNRPIYWLFRSKKGAFQALVYMHRMDAYTATKVRNGYLLPHIEFLRGRIAAESARGAELTAKERTKLKKMQQAMEECLEYDGRLHVVADRMQGINLDDGVAVNYAKFGDVLAKLK